MTLVPDTNIITAILKGNEKVKKKTQEAIIEGKSIFVTGISYYEIKRGLLASNATAQLGRFEAFCEKIGILLMNDKSIFDEAAGMYADLKGKGELIGDADILIAATVKIRKFILVSDDRDFNRIQELKVENWLT